MKNIVALIKYAVVVDSTFLKMYLITNVGKIGKRIGCRKDKAKLQILNIAFWMSEVTFLSLEPLFC